MEYYHFLKILVLVLKVNRMSKLIREKINTKSKILKRGKNMHGSPGDYEQEKEKPSYLWKKLPLFTMSTQEPQWHYRLPWTLS